MVWPEECNQGEESLDKKTVNSNGFKGNFFNFSFFFFLSPRFFIRISFGPLSFHYSKPDINFLVFTCAL